VVLAHICGITPVRSPPIGAEPSRPATEYTLLNRNRTLAVRRTDATRCLLSLGPGKYDEQCTKVRTETLAEGVLLVVYRGTKGSGFSVQAPIPVIAALPKILRDTARQIEESFAKGEA